MCRILLSIHPQFANAIIDESKKFEFRKTKCRKHVDRILIYATAPTGMIIGEVEVVDVLVGEPESIWEQTHRKAGITRKSFDEYYRGKDSAVAYKLGTVKRYSRPRPLSSVGVKSAPQSFIYL